MLTAFVTFISPDFTIAAKPGGFALHHLGITNQAFQYLHLLGYIRLSVKRRICCLITLAIAAVV